MDDRRIYRSHRRRRILTCVLVAVAAVLGAALVYELVGLPAVEALAPSREGFVSDPSPTIVLKVNGLDGLTGVRVSLDGKDVSGKASATASGSPSPRGGLPTACIACACAPESSNVLRRRLDERWSFTVDTARQSWTLDTTWRTAASRPGRRYCRAAPSPARS